MAKSYILRQPTGFNFVRRAIGFIACANDTDLNAGAIFDGLTGKEQQDVRVRMDHWLQGNVYNRYFHGFDTPGYRGCFTFKWHVKRQEHRFYGLLCNPKPRSDPGFQLCALAYHTPKNEMGTDYTILDRINRLREYPAVIAAIAVEYQEYGGDGGANKWRQ